MPIRVEYGPSAVAVGELAYRTGQNEYIAKRRKEMEELAQRQAEMRQRGQAQQQSLQADLYRFHGQQQTAMQQLQQRQQQFQQQGQQFEQGQQQQMQLAEQGREHDLKLEKIHGEQKVADAKMRHGLAQERDFNALANNNLVTMMKTHLNEPGQAEGFKLLKEGQDALNDPRIEPDEGKRINQEKIAQVHALKEDARYTIAKEQRLGYEEGFGAISGGYETNTSHKRVRNAQGDWDVLANMKYIADDGTELTLTQEDWDRFHLPPSYENEAGEIKAPDTFNELTGLWNYKTVSTREQRDALEDQKKSAASAERQKLYGMYQADRDSAVIPNNPDGTPMTFNSWLTDVYEMPEGVEAEEARRMAEEEAAQRQREEEAAQQQNAANLLQDAGLPPVEQAPPERGMPDNPFENAMEAAAVAKPGSRVHIRTPNGGTAEIIVHGR